MNKKEIKHKLLGHTCLNCYYGSTGFTKFNNKCSYASGGVDNFLNQQFPSKMICNTWKKGV